MGSECNGTTPEGQKAKMPEIKFTKLFINGQFVDAVSGTLVDLSNARLVNVALFVLESDANQRRGQLL